MSQPYWTVIVLVSLLGGLAPNCIQAANILSLKPTNGNTEVQPVLEHVDFKSVVMEFVDAQNSGLGHTLSRLLWREIRESTSDLQSTGVIFAYDKYDEITKALQGKDYRDFLNAEYHNAAMRIATDLNTQMAVWGDVLVDKNLLYMRPFLTLIDKAVGNWTAIKLKSRNSPELNLQVEIPHQKLSFAPLITERDSFFRKNFRLRCAQKNGCPKGIELRKSPTNESEVITHMPEGSRIQALDMREQWLEVESPDGGRAWLNVYFVEMTPPQIQLRPGAKTAIYREPGNRGSLLGQVDAIKALDVLDMQRDSKRNPWFKIRTVKFEGWVEGGSVDRLYTFPVVHFVAALYRYSRADYTGSIAEFELFISRAKGEDNSTLATAYQFRAAALLLSDKVQANERLTDAALASASKAIEQTPYDPEAYVLRSFIYVGILRNLMNGVGDLQKALELNRKDLAALNLLNLLIKETGKPDMNLFSADQLTSEMIDTLRNLETRYLR